MKAGDLVTYQAGSELRVGVLKKLSGKLAHFTDGAVINKVYLVGVLTDVDAKAQLFDDGPKLLITLFYEGGRVARRITNLNQQELTAILRLSSSNEEGV